MKQRILTAVVLLLIFFPILLLSGTPVFNIAAAVCCILGVYEMIGCVGLRKHLVLSIPSLLYAAAGPLLARTRFATAYGVLLSITVVYLMYLMFIHVFTSETIRTSDIGTVFLTTVYITVAFTSIIRLRDVSSIGRYIYIFIFIGAWVTDIFAYFGGRLFGKHKLCPKVSPKKTVEGSVCGILFCSLAFVLYSMWVAHDILNSGGIRLSPNYPVIALIGAFISAVSQFGDLTASVIKRDYGIKDYGKIFPGHGGIMDRFDSILAVAPFLFILTGNPDFINIFNQLI